MKFIKNNGLLIFMYGLFVVFIVGLSIAGHQHNNEELRSHGQTAITYSEYVSSGTFIEAVFENWESEFLQMAALVIATIFLRQKGAADSKKLMGKDPVDTRSRFTIIHSFPFFKRRKRTLGQILYANSLSIALLSLFIVSFAFHAFGGVSAHNEEAAFHGESPISVTEYIGTSQFWFESFQNWQSEFLAVGTLLFLSIFLRQQGSPESKPLPEADQKTGHY